MRKDDLWKSLQHARLTARGLLSISLLCAGSLVASENLGLFEGHGDVGMPSKTGSVVFDSANQIYVVSGGGANMWATNDDFHFVWKRLSGNLSLTADIEGLGAGTGPSHRKAFLVIRQSLRPDSPSWNLPLH